MKQSRAPQKNSRKRLVAKAMVAAIFFATSIGGAAALIKHVVLPGFTDPVNRSFTSKYGYGQWLRSKGKPFPVTTAVAERRVLTVASVGEGMMQSEPIQAPIIPLAKIKKVYVQEGQVVAKGQLLAELDTTQIELQIEEAKAALATARADQERVRLGTDHQLIAERPDRDKIRLQEAKFEVEIRKELGQMYEKLAKDKLIARAKLLENRLASMRAYAQMHQSRLALETAEEGHSQSVQIADAAVRAAEIAVSQAEATLADHRVLSPAAGIVERCLVHEGEYNQTAGKPAFVIASGLWFEAHFDQSTLGDLEVGQKAEVRLEAFPGGKFEAVVTQLKRIVSYNQGGPETNRPIRPLGTGAPEWPATFTVRLQLIDAPKAAPGMTGFARSESSRESLTVPSSAVAGLSGSKAMLYCVAADEYQTRQVTIGRSAEGRTEITDGLSNGEVVITAGHQVLQPGDRVVANEPGEAYPSESPEQYVDSKAATDHLAKQTSAATFVNSSQE
ncbi:MAG: efflux RND transporter periplasmic adaptor subunit [Lacipirellulaceae bacterium]